MAGRARTKAAPPRKSPARDRTTPEPDASPGADRDLLPEEVTFALAFLANGGNRTRAYMQARPRASYETARSEGCVWAAKPSIAGFIDAKRSEYWAKLEMSAEEAISLVADAARADVRRLFKENGVMLDPHDWPDDVARSVKALKQNADGSWDVRLTDPLAAQRLVLELQGKLKGAGDTGLRDLAEILAEKWKGKE